jgi:uncharacterized membrane protein
MKSRWDAFWAGYILGLLVAALIVWIRLGILE